MEALGVEKIEVEAEVHGWDLQVWDHEQLIQIDGHPPRMNSWWVVVLLPRAVDLRVRGEEKPAFHPWVSGSKNSWRVLGAISGKDGRGFGVFWRRGLGFRPTRKV